MLKLTEECAVLTSFCSPFFDSGEETPFLINQSFCIFEGHSDIRFDQQGVSATELLVCVCVCILPW